MRSSLNNGLTFLIILSIVNLISLFGLFYSQDRGHPVDSPAPVQAPVEPEEGNGDAVLDLGGGRTLRVPAGHTASITFEDSGSVGETRETTSSEARSEGPSVEGDDIKDFDLGLHSLSLSDLSISAGAVKGAFFKALKSNIGVLYVIGGLCAVGGIIWAVGFKAPLSGYSMAGGGLLLIVTARAIETAPWLAYVAFGAILLAVLFVVYEYWQSRQDKEALAVWANAQRMLPTPVRSVINEVVEKTAAAHRTSALPSAMRRAGIAQAKKPDPDLDQVEVLSRVKRQVGS